MCVARAGSGLLRVGTGSGSGATGQELAGCAIPLSTQEQGRQGHCLVAAGEWQCSCSPAGIGAHDPKDNEMGSWERWEEELMRGPDHR